MESRPAPRPAAGALATRRPEARALVPPSADEQVHTLGEHDLHSAAVPCADDVEQRFEEVRAVHGGHDRVGQPAQPGGRVGGDSPGDVSDRERLQTLLSKESKTATTALWLVFIGHGTFDGQSAKFNLRGPDVTAAMLNEWLTPFERTVAVIDCSSSSAPFINRLSHPGRIVLTATKSGYEMNFARFGEYLATAIARWPLVMWRRWSRWKWPRRGKLR